VGLLGRGCPPPQPTRGPGERREQPQQGLGRSPGRQCILGIFQGLRSLLVERTGKEIQQFGVARGNADSLVHC